MFQPSLNPVDKLHVINLKKLVFCVIFLNPLSQLHRHYIHIQSMPPVAEIGNKNISMRNWKVT